jgi:dolichol kinase
MAGLIGRRFGRIKLIHGRSLEGTLSFFVSGFAVSFGLLALIHPSVMISEALVIAAVASLFGAVAELFSLRLDDNLSVPVASALGAMLVMLVF